MTPFELENRYSAHNYEPLPVVLSHGSGAHLFDIEGRRYIDMMSAYSAAKRYSASAVARTCSARPRPMTATMRS